jgi:hypothetical protein
MLRTGSRWAALGRGSWPVFCRGVSGLAAGTAPRIPPRSAAPPLLSLLAQVRLQGLLQRLDAVRMIVVQYQSRLNAIEAVIASQLGTLPSSGPSAASDATTSALAWSPSGPTQPTAALPVTSREVSDRALFSIYCRLAYEDFTEDNYPRTQVVNEYLDDHEQVDQATVQTSYDRFLHAPVQIHKQPGDRNSRPDRGDEREEGDYCHGPQGSYDGDGVDDTGRTVRRTGIIKEGALGKPTRRRASSRARTSGTSPRANSRKGANPSGFDAAGALKE